MIALVLNALIGAAVGGILAALFIRRHVKLAIDAAYATARNQVNAYREAAESIIDLRPDSTKVARWRGAAGEASAALLQVADLIDAGDLVVRPGRGVKARRRDLQALASVCVDRGHELLTVGVARGSSRSLPASLEEHGA
jgi:uncharacterized membrane protein YccC